MKIETKLKKVSNAVLFVAFFALMILSVNAQKKGTVSKTKKPAAPVANSASEVRAGADKVSIQLKNVSKFIYLLGSVASGIESIDKDAKAGKASRTVIDKNVQFKQSVITGIKNLRAGLVSLEIEFRTKPALSRYLLQLQGISDLAGTAEDQATGGQFTESGKTFLLVIEKLTDTLVALP